MKKNNNKGFTLAELLIVVAIIAVLVAIAIPVFTAQLEKSRESTDAANARSAYAEMMASAITDEALTKTGSSYSFTTTGTAGARTYTATIPCKQQQDGWQNTSIDNIAGQAAPTGVGAGKNIVITYVQNTDTLTVTAGGGTTP